MVYPNSYTVALVSAVTALVASILGPFVTLSVARWQFRAKVVSTNRQKWIVALRDQLAALLSLIKAAQAAKRASAERWRGGTAAVITDPALASKLEEAYMAIAQIQLLTSDDDPRHKALNFAISQALDCLEEDELREPELSAHIQDITRLGRDISGETWRRVKRGV